MPTPSATKAANYLESACYTGSKSRFTEPNDIMLLPWNDCAYTEPWIPKVVLFFSCW